MAREGSERAGCWRRAGAPDLGQVSDSDSDGESPAGAEARGPAEERRAAAEALRPEQALRRVAVRVDPALLEDAGGPGRPGLCVPRRTPAPGPEPQVDPSEAGPLSPHYWSARSRNAEAVLVPLEVWAADEQDLLVLLEPEEFLQGLVQLTQTQWPGRQWVLPAAAPKTGVLNLGLQTRGPSGSVPWLCPKSSTRPHVAVIGLEAHLWYQSHQPSSRDVRQPESPAVARAPVTLSWPKVEEALVLLQLWAHLDVLLVASWQGLTQHVCAFTRALAQRPGKRYRDSRAFSFCVAGRWAAGERVARDGTGLRGVWWQQIRQFHRVSPAVADAIVTAFPSPCLLQQAYTSCSTEQERLALLVDLPVKTGAGERPRRVGPDLSRRICLFLTTTDPELLLDLGP